MNKKLKQLIYASCLLLCLLYPFSIKADIVYPARLELTETKPGYYQVYFVLPVINGKVLKAVPVFPDFCESLEKSVIGGSNYTKELRWKIKCEPGSLYGQTIGIDGILGSNVDIILNINTLEGRNYQTKLSPASAYFIVPPPPSWFALSGKGIYHGLRLPVTHYVLLLLLPALFLLFRNRINTQLIYLIPGILAGYILTHFELLRTPGWLFELTTLILSLSLVIEYFSGKRLFLHDNHVGILLLICGIFLGGDQNTFVSPSGLTPAEATSSMLWTMIGIIAGTIFLALLIGQGLKLLELALTKTPYQKGLAMGIGIVTLGVLFHLLSMFWITPSLFPPVPFVLWLVMILIALFYASTHRQNIRFPLLWLTLALSLGTILGFNGIAFKYTLIILLLSVSILVILRSFKLQVDSVSIALLLLITGLCAGLFLAEQTNNYISYALARSIEFALILIFFGVLLTSFSVAFLSVFDDFKHRKALKIILYSLVASLVLLILYDGYGNSIKFRENSPFLQLPLLSLGLLILAFFAWPKKRKVHKDMGIKDRKPVFSILAITSALCFLPVVTNISNPWFDSRNMNNDQIKAVMQSVLSNTYTAFNISDEERLFETLSYNVDNAMLDNIYLDSRRRLTMGLREGAEVTVQEVKVDQLGEMEEKSMENSYSYPASWTVTARVKHLKHIHYRRNRYTGIIELKTENDSWKISKIILNSEEREVIPSATL